MRPSASPIAIWTGLIVLYLVWGSTYLGIKVAIDTVPPFVMGFLRFVPAGILLAGAVALRHRRTVRRPTRREVIDTSIVGGFLLLGGMGLVAWAEQTIPTGIAALLIALMPMWLAIFGRVLLGERLPRAGVLGIAIGVVGVAILAWPTSSVDDLDPAGLVALLASPVFWALGSIYAARRAVLPTPALFASGLQMVAGGLILLAASVVTGELPTFDVAAVSRESWLGLLYLLVVGSLVGYTTFAWLLSVAPLPRVATYAYVNPVVAVFLGALLLNEPITPRTIVATIVIVAAVVLIVTARGRVRPTVAETPPRPSAIGEDEEPALTAA
jgi:drug/metabolite transporter (DMT)-like permease